LRTFVAALAIRAFCLLAESAASFAKALELRDRSSAWWLWNTVIS
jgi:hypothetical protein